MPEYRYTAVDTEGRKVKGKITSDDFQAAKQELHKRPLYVQELKESKLGVLSKEIKLFEPRVSSRDFVAFCRQLAILLRAGVSLVDAVHVLYVQTKSKPMKHALQEMEGELRRGTPFSRAAAAHPRIFSQIFISMAQSGEISGNLDDVLDKLARFYEKEHVTREKVKSAMMYPAVVSGFAVVVTIILLVAVIPGFVATYQEMGLTLPWPTRAVIWTSEWLISWWYLILAIFGGGVAIFRHIMSKPYGRKAFDRVKLKMPVFGLLFHKTAIARMTRTLASLLTSSVPILQSLNITADVAGNAYIAQLIRQAGESVRKGGSLAEPLKQDELFPPMAAEMIAVGEQTGSLQDMLQKIADFYEADVDALADRLKTLLEPFLILAVTLLVSIIVLAVLLPSFRLYENFL